MTDSLVKDYLQLLFIVVNDFNNGLDTANVDESQRNRIIYIQNLALNVFADTITSVTSGTITTAANELESAAQAHKTLILSASPQPSISAAWTLYEGKLTALCNALPAIPAYYQQISVLILTQIKELEVYRTQDIYLPPVIGLLNQWALALTDYEDKNVTAWNIIKNKEIEAQKTGHSIYDSNATLYSGYIKDGNYGREVNRISPEGFVYGATSWVKDFQHFYWWNGLQWKKIPETVGQSNSVALLPQTAYPPDTIWRCLVSISPEGNSTWKYFYFSSDTQSWVELTWYWTVYGGSQNLRSTGYKKGDAHVVVEPDVELMWDGEEWRRRRISSLEDDLRITSSLSGLVATTTELRGDHNELVESFLGYQNKVAQDLVDITKFANIADKQLTANIAKLITDITSFTENNSMSETEANNLKLDISQIVLETNKVLAIATELGITTEKTAYESALSQLQEEIAVWIDQPQYPLNVVEQDKADIIFCATELQDRRAELHTALADKFDGTIVDYTIEQIDDVDDSIDDIQEDLGKFSSDGFITFVESKALKISLVQLQAESADLVAIATALGITTEKTAYTNALAALALELADWVGKPESDYPIAVVTLDRTQINDALALVKSTKATLAKKIRDLDRTYVNDQIDDVNEALGTVQADILEFSSDGFITFTESVSLKTALNTLNTESTDLITIATSLGITTQKTNYSSALTNLSIAVSPWIDLAQSAYPKAVTGAQRTDLLVRLETVQNTKSLLVNEIIRKRQEDVAKYLNNQISDANSSQTALYNEWNNRTSDHAITAAEAASLRIINAQYLNEVDGLKAIADSVSLTALSLTYKNAALALVAGINSIINVYEYPVFLINTAYATADMTANNAPSPNVVSSGTTQYSGSEVWNAFDQNAATFFRSSPTITAGYIRFDYGAANSAIIVGYAWLPQAGAYNGRMPSGFVLKGSNDATNWTTLDTQTSQSFAADAWSTYYTFNNATAYRYYQMDMTKSAADYISFAELKLVIAGTQNATIEALFVTAKSTKKALVDALTATGTYGVGGIGFDVSQFRKVYDGFVRGFTPELRLVYISQNELSLQPNYGDFDYLKVNDQNIEASKRTSVFTFTPVLGWNENAQALYTSTLQADTEYWVYLANRDDRFKDDIPGGVYDYRGRLFCSGTDPSNNYLGEAGLGLHAILIGKAETDNNSKFRHELGVSLVSRQSDLKETFREFSDFDLTYTDEDTLTLDRTYGTYGQIYIPESLYYIGENREVYTTSPRIEVDVSENLVYDSTTIAANTLYYVYIAADSDIYNFNSINPATNLPWHPEDSSPTPSLYVADKDFRLWMFLSTKEPEEGRLAETYSGYWARHIGQVRTDGNGKFIYSGSVSAIRQATLNPTYFDGLAEISILDVSASSFKIIRKRGTSGIVMVGSKGVLTYDADNPGVHIITIYDTVYSYNEATPSSPLSSTGTILDIYIGREMFVYLANESNCWGSLKNRTFLCNAAPSKAYLSQNFPGNNARWICTVNMKAGTSGAELVTNGSFASDANWVTTGWTWSGANLNIAHNAGNTSQLAQSAMTVVAGGTYELLFTTSGVGAGSVTPKLGNTDGAAVTVSQANTQHIIAANTDVLKFVPTSTFNGAIDTVICKKIEHGAFSGSYIADSIAKNTVIIDDMVTSPNITWSSQKIMQVINDTLGVGGNTAVLSSEKAGGLVVRLEYVNTTTVRLIPVSGQDSYVVFPDLSSRTIPAAGITLTVSGSANTRYYVYLSSSSLTMSETAPDGIFAKLETLGTANIQVGDICMTSTNTMSGDWNVCSSHQGVATEWTTAINAASVSLTKTGLMLSKRASVAVSRTGLTAWRVGYYYYPDWYWSSPYYIVTGTDSQTFFVVTGTITVTLTGTTGEGINSNAFTYTDVISHDYGTAGACEVTGRTGNLVIIRSST